VKDFDEVFWNLYARLGQKNLIWSVCQIRYKPGFTLRDAHSYYIDFSDTDKKWEVAQDMHDVAKETWVGVCGPLDADAEDLADDISSTAAV
jgi:hypothetical protein